MSTMEILRYFAVFVIVAIAVLVPLAILKEQRLWNNGICKKSKRPWVKFAERHGYRGYTDKANNYCWILFPIDKSRP